jgi:hypothetical protein
MLDKPAFNAEVKNDRAINLVPVVPYSPRRYPSFDVVVGLVWPHDPKSYAGGSI